MPTGDVVNFSCTLDSPGIGGACFNVLAGSASVGIVIDDDVATAPIGANVRFFDAEFTVLGAASVCGTGALSVPAGAATAQIWPRTLTTQSGCTGTGRATSGSITVQWS